jgi:hypothetical protein
MAATATDLGILTFHRCINYGSYWQARCLAEGLHARGADAVLLEHESSDITKAEWRCAFQPQLPMRTLREDLPRYAAKTRKFLEAFDRLPRSRPFPLDHPEQMDRHELIMVGSDEVWNLCHPWYGGKSIFYGDGLNAGRIASYAASFGNQDAAGGLSPDWAAKLARFDAVSVRDENSRKLVSKALHREPSFVLDPCLQFPEPARRARRATQRYAIVYGHSFPHWFERAIRAWADRTGMRLLSVGYRNAFADEQRIEAGPEEFADLIAGAQAVATNFFHGCVFSLLNEKPFVCATSAYRSNKVRDLTVSLGASRHLVDENATAETFDELLGLPLDAAIPGRIDGLRRQSNAYLDHVLG